MPVQFRSDEKKKKGMRVIFSLDVDYFYPI